MNLELRVNKSMTIIASICEDRKDNNSKEHRRKKIMKRRQIYRNKRYNKRIKKSNRHKHTHTLTLEKTRR